MIYTGQAAIEYLVTKVNMDDSAASSYWRKYHSTFNFTGDGFEGLQLLGRSEKSTLWRRVLHRLLQRRIRRMGAQFSQFNVFDKVTDKIMTRQGRVYNFDVLRHTFTLAFLKKHVPNSLSVQSTACVIGDGFGLMTALLLASRSASRVVLVNLSKTLLVDLWYLKLWMGEEAFESSVDLVTDEDGLACALAKPATDDVKGMRVVAIQASDHQLLGKCPVDIVLNIASMQEMDPLVTAAYFEDMRAIARQRELIFYCCNREEKILPDSTVIRFAAYPWHENDQILVDELCPWHQFFYSLRPPFFKPYDGPHRHRLVTL